MGSSHITPTQSQTRRHRSVPLSTVHTVSTHAPQVFQQIDIEDSVDQQTGGTTLRMFGVTEVRTQIE